MASPSSVAEKSRVCLRQRVSPAICSISRRSPYPAYGLLRQGSVFQPRGNRSSLLLCIAADVRSWQPRCPVFAEHFRVVHIGHAAGDGGNIQMCMFRQFTGMIGHLHRQFASWGEDQNTRWTGFLTREIEQVLQRWQQIRRRFTGACRRRTEYITAIERRRNGGSLNGGRASETFIWRASSRLSSSSSSEKVVTVMFYLCVGR